MTTAAISGLSAACYRDDPDIASVSFTNLALADLGDHLTYRAASGYRYWATCTLIEKQVHGTGGWIDITSSCTVNMLTGSITVSSALNADDLVRATGTRRSEANFIKVINLYAGKLVINGKEIDITSCESAGWTEVLNQIKSWEFTAEAFFYYHVTNYPEKDTDDLTQMMYAKFYSNYSGAKSWVGKGMLKNIDLVLADPNNVQKKTLRLMGTTEIFPEL